MKNMKMHASVLLVMTIVVLSGCASIQPPKKLSVQADTLIKQAKVIGAEEHAPVILRDANLNFEEGQMAMNQGEYRKAKRALERAVVDAEFAVAKTGAAKSKKSAKEISESLEIIDEQL